MPLFSVITPVFNRAALLREMLASVAEQQFKDFEVIIVDDGSSDDSVQAAQDSGVKLTVLRQENRGPGAARNLGMREAGGEYMAFLDSDDLWFPWTLQTYARVISGNRNPSFIAGKPQLFQEKADLSNAREEDTRFSSFPDYLASGDEWRWWGASSFVIRRDAMLACGGFAEANVNGEDADLALKLGTAPGFVQVTSPTTFGYRQHAAQVTTELQKTLDGVWHKISMERAGRYPGGAKRARERWRILSRHARPVMLACLRVGRSLEGWKMYRATFSWHVLTGRWKFLVGFPWQALTRRLRASAAVPAPV